MVDAGGDGEAGAGGEVGKTRRDERGSERMTEEGGWDQPIGSGGAVASACALGWSRFVSRVAWDWQKTHTRLSSCVDPVGQIGESAPTDFLKATAQSFWIRRSVVQIRSWAHSDISSAPRNQILFLGL